MKRRLKIAILTLLSFILTVVVAGQLSFAEEQDGYLTVTGPCNLEFPKDHGSHPGYRTEWWYYTGNLRAASGDRFGFQLTFFRSQISPAGAQKRWPQPSSAWRTQQIYLGHAAISDISAKRHFQAERLAREALGMAGASQVAGTTRLFIHSWLAQIGKDAHMLKVQTDDFSFELELEPVKLPVSHGKAGYSRKGSTPERAGCYYSFTRFQSKGTLTVGGKTVSVQGFSWMDHEFSTASLEPGIVGWDWFSLQLSDQTEIMVYLLRKKKGGLHPASSGTYVDGAGRTRHLGKDELKVTVLDTWRSRQSNAMYPARWQLTIAPMAIELMIAPNLSDQEMQTQASTGVIYWEGSVSAKGTKNGIPIDATGYVELTGYAKPFDAPM